MLLFILLRSKLIGFGKASLNPEPSSVGSTSVPPLLVLQICHKAHPAWAIRDYCLCCSGDGAPYLEMATQHF